MKIKILGSGGGEGFPAPFCCCEHCETARKMGGKSLRTLSQTINDDELLIDLPYDTNAHCLRFNVNLGKIENIIITHSHSDHYEPSLLALRGGFNAHNMKFPVLNVCGPADLKPLCDKIKIPENIISNIRFKVLKPYEKVEIGSFSVTPIIAFHATTLGSLNYIIEKDSKTILYLLDSGYPTEETFDFLKGLNKVFDFVVMDGTMGVAPPLSYVYHMGFEENKILKSKLIKQGIANNNTRFVTNHITHNKAEYHEKTEEIFYGTEIEVAFDGMEIEI
jgi:phosphoribosyl 1,2-cyclic phosphate phosphodiesterase